MSGLTRHGVRRCSTILGRNLLLRHSLHCAVARGQEVAGFLIRIVLSLASPHAEPLGASSLSSRTMVWLFLQCRRDGVPVIWPDRDAGAMLLPWVTRGGLL